MLVSVCFLVSVSQLGMFLVIELSSSSRQILEWKSASVSLFVGVSFRESCTLWRIVFLISFWYSPSLCMLGEHLNIPFPCFDLVMSSVREKVAWSVTS